MIKEDAAQTPLTNGSSPRDSAPQQGLEAKLAAIRELRDTLHSRLCDQNGYSSVEIDGNSLVLVFNLKRYAIVPQFSSTPLLQKIVEMADLGSAQEFGDAEERLRAIRGLIIGEVV